MITESYIHAYQVLFNAVLENACSEQGARMSAMDSSSRNAGDMLDRLTLTYNRSLNLYDVLFSLSNQILEPTRFLLIYLFSVKLNLLIFVIEPGKRLSPPS